MSVEVPAVVQERLDANGGTYFVLESTWWGNQKFGVWGQAFSGHVEAETDSAVLFRDVQSREGGPVGGGWVPKSKIVQRYDAPEPENHVIVEPDGEVRVGTASEGDYQISRTDFYHGRYKRYPKFVVDFDYQRDDFEEMKENFKRPDEDGWWDRFHATAKVEGDEFRHWWMDADVNIMAFAQELSNGEWSVAIRQDFIDNGE